jgi:hypothetical protein
MITKKGEKNPGTEVHVSMVMNHTMAISTFSGTRLLDNCVLNKAIN